MTAYVVDTTGGKVRGAEIDEGVLAWRGIPYAAPPVGPSRLRLPRRAEPWSGVRDATAYGAPAPQPPMPVPAGAAGPTDAPVLPEPSEDCLYVNVTAPADAGASPSCCGSTAADTRSAPGATSPGTAVPSHAATAWSS